MILEKKYKKRGNFKIFSSHSFFTEGVSVLWKMLICLLIGVILQTLIILGINSILKIVGISPSSELNSILMIIGYIILFIPAIIYVSIKSKQNISFEEDKFDIDRLQIKKKILFTLLPILFLCTIALSFICEPIVSLLPPMPESLKAQLNALIGGNFYLNFISVSILAPVLEEWLCRGIVLRSLVYGKKAVKPYWAIIFSALFFAFIHLNPWQAIPAFLLGSLFGYVYYKTGSLKLTIFMHFVNNTFSLIMTRLIPNASEIDGFYDILDKNHYYIILACCLIISILSINFIKRLEVLEKNRKLISF